MATLGSLIISLECQTAKFTDALTKAEYTAKKASDNIMGAFKVMGTALAAAFSLSSLDASFTRITDMEASLLKVANRLGTTVEVLSSFSVMARKTGMDTEAFNTALTRMERNVSTAALANENATTTIADIGESSNKAAGALREMGLKAAVVNQLPLDQKLLAFAAGMEKNIAPADQVRVAMDLFGRGGAGMVNVLSQGPEAMQKWIDRATELGLITTDMATRATAAKSAAGDLSLAWAAFARELVDAVAPAITTVLNLLSEMITKREQAQAALGMMHGESSWNPESMKPSWAGEPSAQPTGGSGWGGDYTSALTTPTRAKPTSGGKGGSGDMGLGRMSTIIDTLRKDLNKLTEGSLAEITAWATHMRNEITKVGAKGAEISVAMALVDKVETAKKLKATEDYGLFVAKESGDTYAIIEAQGRADLEKYKGFSTAKAVTDAATNRKKLEEQAKNNEEVWGLQKNVFDSLASLTPVISEQNFLKKKSLDLEILIGKSTLDQKLAKLELSHVISKAQADEFRGLQALEAQAKRTNLAMEQDKGLKGWAFERNKSVSQQNTIKDMMSGAESYITNAFSSGIQGVLSKDKNALKDIGKTMFQGFLAEIQKGAITKSFDALAKIISPQKGVTGGKDDNGLGQAAGLLSGAGLQLGLSAGGLALSGIGIMTNSQALVYAGTVLQIAGLAIQLYEALTSTETVVSMTIAATALTGSALALEFAADALIMAAMVDAIPFFHTGGLIYAHSGLKLASDERLIVGQTGERVLSRSQNRVYEAGMAGGGGTVNHISVTHSPTYLYRATQKDYDRDAKMLTKAIKREMGNKLSG